MREVFEIPVGQIAFDVLPCSHFEPGDKRPIASNSVTGDMHEGGPHP